MSSSSRTAGFFAVLTIALSAVSASADTLESGWKTPPDEAKPRVWWHWICGNVSKQGIVGDLDALADAGIGGVTIFDAGLRVPSGPVAFNTPAWYDHVLFAIREARRRGLSVTLASCSGWSSSGGPWVAPRDAMKFVETSETVVEGGRRVEIDLPQPPSEHGFYEDIAVLAFPRPASERQDMLDEKFEIVSAYTNDAAVLRRIADGSDEPVFRPRRFEGDPCAFTYRFERPYRACSLYVKLQDGGWWQDKCPFRIEVSDDGSAWRQVAAFDVVTCQGGQLEWSAKRVPFPEATARCWRVTMHPSAESDPNGMYTVAELRLDRRVALSALPAKTFRVAAKAKTDDFIAAADQVVKSSDILDVTRFCRGGRLAWDAPAGEWTVLRVGMAANGQVCHPATDAGRGPEVDKLAPAAIRRHFDAYVGKIAAQSEIDGKSGLTGVLVDSYESGSQNWTQGFEQTLQERLGYDFVPQLVLFSGRIVDSVTASEKRLADFRSVVAARFAEAYGGTMQQCCHERGLTFELEPYGNFPGDGEAFGRHADIPMTEFWSGRSPRVGRPYDPTAYRTTLRIARQAHTTGRRIVQAEGFTNAGGGYGQTPFTLKSCGDRQFALGVNRMVIHRFVHQPWAAHILPGMTMAQFGTNFDRTQTWWPFVKPFVAYLTRTQYLLQEGEYVACGGEGPLAWLDRRYADGTYGRFVALDNAAAETRKVTLPVAGRSIELWNPETGEITPLAAEERNGETEVTVDFNPSGSAFLLARPVSNGQTIRQSPPRLQQSNNPTIQQSNNLSATLSIAGRTLRGFPDWSESDDPAVRYFSGIAEYALDVPQAGELDLGEVHELAEVSANGKVLATLWRPPYRCRVPSGRITVRVANLWINRLIGDERLPPDRVYGWPGGRFPDALREIPDWVRTGGKSPTGRSTFAAWRFHSADDQLQPSGILGPVALTPTE